MKKSITCLFSIFMVILFICSLATIIQAAPTANEPTYTAEQDGLSLTVTTDKEEYSVGQDITVTVTLQNNNDVSVYYRRNSIFANNAIPTLIAYNDENNFIDMSYYGEDPMIQDYELAAGESIAQNIRFKSGYTEESYIGYFDETKDFIEAPARTYKGKSVFDYSLEKGENTKALTLDFDVVIKSMTDDPFINYKSYSEENGVSLTASTVKPIYAHGEKIEFNVSFKNSNDFSVNASNTEVTLYNLDTQTEYDFDILEKIDITDTEIKSDEILEQLFTKENNNNPLSEGEYLAIATVKYSIESENMSDKIWANSFFKISNTLAENIYSTTQDDLELTISLPKTEYLEGEDIIIDCSLKNNGSVPVYQAHSPGTAWYGEAKAVNKETEETYYFSKSLPQVNRNVALMNGETFNWEEIAYFHNFAEDRLPAGEYTIMVYSDYGFDLPPEKPEDMDSSDNAYTIEVSVDFTVKIADPNPEPISSDLAVSAVAANSVAPEEGEAIKLNATVRNYGEKKYEGDVTVNFYKNGILISTVSQTVELTPGGYTVIASDKAAEFAFGLQTIYADISCDDLHEDTDSDNNIVKSRVVVE